MELELNPKIGLCEKLFSPFQTIFEINSNSKTVACKVMRRKRSRDTRLVEKYSKKREDQVTESRLLHAHLPVIPSNQTVAETLGVEGSEEEEELLQGHATLTQDGQALIPPTGAAQPGKQTNLQAHGHLLWYMRRALLTWPWVGPITALYLIGGGFGTMTVQSAD